MVPAGPDPPSPERRRLPFPLASPMHIGLIGTMAVLVVVGLRFVLPAWRQYVAIREIERRRGTVHLSPTGPEWLRGRLPDGWMKPFGEVDEVILWETNPSAPTNLTDATMEHVAVLSGLKVLALDCSPVTTAGLAHIKGMH